MDYESIAWILLWGLFCGWLGSRITYLKLGRAIQAATKKRQVIQWKGTLFRLTPVED